TALAYLSCPDNQLTRLDVTKNTALTTLSCGYNALTSLDVSNNTALTTLRCYHNQLTSLDVSKNTALTSLECCNNQLTGLDVSKNTTLKFLNCYDNKIKGTNMDDLISSLPNIGGKILIYYNNSRTEGNVCTRTQVAAIKGKGWTPYYWDIDERLEYEGSDGTTGKMPHR
ncbi:MAG: leucine-rich repeat domain-containing protein, partial [Prevotellaceae bacterium]|nr:leucine-rich repeat domain-containing protein [Prevotellaceae bacterium]